MSKGIHVIEFRKRIKVALVKAFGGKCQVCGQEHPEYIFDFHHLDPSTKSFGIGSATTTRSKDSYADEAKKCIMVCANCHRYIENGGLDVSSILCSFDENVYYNTIDELVGRNQEIKEEAKPIFSTKPDREQLKMDIRTMPMLQVGYKYSVSDNAVRKWCKSYNLPSRVSDIKTYTDEEWAKL